jgi:hypothetical protein
MVVICHRLDRRRLRAKVAATASLPPRRTNSNGGKPMPEWPEACNEVLRQRGCDLIMAPPSTTLKSSLTVEVFLVTTDTAGAC